MANESYSEFVSGLQSEIEKDTNIRFGIVEKHSFANVKKDDIVLFAGKGHEQYQLIRGGKMPFSERRLIEKYASELARV